MTPADLETLIREAVGAADDGRPTSTLTYQLVVAIQELQDEIKEDDGVRAVWRGRLERSEARERRMREALESFLAGIPDPKASGMSTNGPPEYGMPPSTAKRMRAEIVAPRPCEHCGTMLDRDHDDACINHRAQLATAKRDALIALTNQFAHDFSHCRDGDISIRNVLVWLRAQAAETGRK